MSSGPSTNRSMFWRIVRRLLFAHRGRLFVILLALVAGATITAALLNLQVDAKRRITSEFRAFGANALISPRSVKPEETLDESVFDQIPRKNGVDVVPKSAFLYGVADASPWDAQTRTENSKHRISAVIAGYRFFGHDFSEILPSATRAPGLLRYEI